MSLQVNAEFGNPQLVLEENKEDEDEEDEEDEEDFAASTSTDLGTSAMSTGKCLDGKWRSTPVDQLAQPSVVCEYGPCTARKQ